MKSACPRCDPHLFTPQPRRAWSRPRSTYTPVAHCTRCGYDDGPRRRERLAATSAAIDTAVMRPGPATEPEPAVPGESQSTIAGRFISLPPPRRRAMGL